MINTEENRHKIVVAGPCSAENVGMLQESAKEIKKIIDNFLHLKRAYATTDNFRFMFRAGLWKPRTKPGSFEGMGESGLEVLQHIQQQYSIGCVTEATTPKQAAQIMESGLSGLWIGARTCANPIAVQEIAQTIKENLSKCDNPFTIFVKNPVNPDLQLWIGNIERIKQTGIQNIVAVHRGFSHYKESIYRNDPLWSIATELKVQYPMLPLLCDPSHMGGDKKYVQELSQQALDLDYEGVMIEVHPTPERALSDSAQQLSFPKFETLLGTLNWHNNIQGLHDKGNEINNLLKPLRQEIDITDNEILSLLIRRMQLSAKIGEIKRQENVTLLQKGRWSEVLEGIVKSAKEKGLSQEFVKDIWNRIHEESLKSQTHSPQREP